MDFDPEIRFASSARNHQWPQFSTAVWTKTIGRRRRIRKLDYEMTFWTLLLELNLSFLNCTIYSLAFFIAWTAERYGIVLP
jgi:hypothetical protein